MNANELLNQITIPTPCPVNWSAMTGDDRVRFCASCEKHVYNFSAMSSDEAIALIRDKNGELCGQLYRREDGTLVTSDCQPRPQPPSPSPWQFSLRSTMAVIAGFAGAFGLARLLYADRTQPPPPATPTSSAPTGGSICIPPNVMQTISNQSSGQSE